VRTPLLVKAEEKTKNAKAAHVEHMNGWERSRCLWKLDVKEDRDQYQTSVLSLWIFSLFWYWWPVCSQPPSWIICIQEFQFLF
jgi:hypothetical protein